ncbi:MAG TPA: MFS transporter [Ktedonobacteraceae bacterium]|nr:MFS transporter [Ktedonobacteraceae bacterium]
MSRLQNTSSNSKNPTAPDTPGATIRPTSLWRNREFLLLWSGQIVSATGSQVSLLAFPWLILAVTGSPVQAGLIAAIRTLPYILFGLPAGALVDRWNRKKVMILCDTGRALALGSIPIAFALGYLTALQLYLVSCIEGTLFIFFGLAESAALPRVVSVEQLSAATAQNEFVYSVSGLIGPSLSGLLYSIGNAMPFLADAVSYVISVCSLSFIKTKFQEERVAAPRKLWVEILEGMNWLWHHKVMRFLAILVSGFELCSAGYVLIVLVLAQQQHASKIATGLIFAGGGIGSIVGAFIVGPLARRFTVGSLMIAASWLWAVTWLPFAVAPNPFLLGVAVAAAFIVVPIHASVQYGYRLASIPDKLQGRVNSIYRIVLFGCQSLGLLLAGILLQASGPVLTVLILFVPQAALAIAATLNKHLRDAPRLSEVKAL